MRTTLITLLGLAACANGTDALTLDIAGTWEDQFGISHVITADSWEQASASGSQTFEILDFDNTADWAIAQNGADNEYSAELYSRFEWTESGSAVHYCQVLFDGATEDDARDAGPADASDLTAGCGGFAWSELTP